MLFACSGIPIPHGRTRQSLTRFVTSAHLVTQFNENRNKDDKLRVGAANHCVPSFFFVYIQANCGHPELVLVHCFYFCRLQCAFLIIQLPMGS
jgi:hypothetical protein